MTRFLPLALFAALLLAACSQPKNVDITRGSQAVQTARAPSRSSTTASTTICATAINESLKVFDMKVTGTTGDDEGRRPEGCRSDRHIVAWPFRLPRRPARTAFEHPKICWRSLEPAGALRVVVPAHILIAKVHTLMRAS